MKATLAIVAGALLLAIALAISAPASLLDACLSAVSSGRLRIADAEGTLWNGSGELVLLPGGTRRALVWHIEAWPLLRGQVQGTIAAEATPAQRADFAYGQQRVELRHFELAVPMDSVLTSAGVPAALATAGGSVAARVERLVHTPDTIDAQITLQWRDASLPGARPGSRIALGEVQLQIDGRGPEIAGALSNRGGDVDIAGRVALSAALAPRLEATVRPREGIDRDRADGVAAALSLIGSADGQGGYRLAWPRS
jgi:general secretion pathway protein N